MPPHTATLRIVAVAAPAATTAVRMAAGLLLAAGATLVATATTGRAIIARAMNVNGLIALVGKLGCLMNGPLTGFEGRKGFAAPG